MRISNLYKFDGVQASMAVVVYTVLSVIIVSLVSFIGIASLYFTRNTLGKLLMVLVSISAGTLLGDAFLHLLPEAVEEEGFTLTVGLLSLAGVIIFFIVEKIIHLRKCEAPHPHDHPLLHQPHKHHIGILNLFGDGVHNFIDGLVIAGSYLVSVPVGIATTIAVILHEAPQELADFGVLLYAGFSKSKALLFNFFSAALAILGAVVGLLVGAAGERFAVFILPITAGGFIYIAGSNLIPELHKECGVKDSLLHFSALLAGIALMAGLLFLE